MQSGVRCVNALDAFSAMSNFRGSSAANARYGVRLPMAALGQQEPFQRQRLNDREAAQSRRSGARVNRRLGWTTASPVDAKASAPRNFLFHMEQEYAVPAV
jgi:hypothetical protein